MQIKKKKLIVTVCRGNIARSAFAEEVIKKEIHERGIDDKYLSISRGVQGTSVDPQPVKFPNITYYETLYKETRPILKRFDIDLSSHMSAPIDKDIAEKARILLVMDRKTKQALLTLFPYEANKVHMLSELINEDREIVDPEGVSGEKKQEQIFTEVRDIILRGFPKLLKLLQTD